MRFQPIVATSAENALRNEVREFLAEELPLGSYLPASGFNAHHSPEFSRKLAERGWVGMAISSQYGGHDRGPVDRFIVSEELLAAGAPAAAHWVADRQTAPALLAFGTEFQKQHFLPRIARGECYFSIGMSEPDAGSDLASVRTTGTKVEGGWSISGTKIWTSWAHRNHFFMVLCRTSPLDGDRHDGLSQFIIDLSAPGVTVNAILSLDGSQHFNEVVLDGVFVPDDMVLGEIGMGWQQVTSELTHERSGPERFLSPWPLLGSYLQEAVADAGATSDPLGFAGAERGSSLAAEKIGGLVARYWVLHHLSFSVARALQKGSAPAVEAAIVKDLGTSFEQEVVATLQGLVEDDPDPTSSSPFESLLAEAILVAPSFTIRGGTTEILRSVIARDLGRGR